MENFYCKWNKFKNILFFILKDERKMQIWKKKKRKSFKKLFNAGCHFFNFNFCVNSLIIKVYIFHNQTSHPPLLFFIHRYHSVSLLFNLFKLISKTCMRQSNLIFIYKSSYYRENTIRSNGDGEMKVNCRNEVEFAYGTQLTRTLKSEKFKSFFLKSFRFV